MVSSPTVAEVWVRFAAAAMQNKDLTPNGVGERADDMMDQFRKRFEWYSGGYGTFWKERTRRKGGVMPHVPKGTSIRDRAVKVLAAEPFLTAWDIAIELGEKSSTVSSVLCKDARRAEGLVSRRVSKESRRGFEYFVRAMG